MNSRPVAGRLWCEEMEATTGFEPVMGVLQTPALPLGYVAVSACRFDDESARRNSGGRGRIYMLVPRRRFELLHPCGHGPLKTACLPIPPPRHMED